MFAGIGALIFNPSAWLAVFLAFSAGWAGGVFKGWADSRAEQYKVEIVELRKASKRKDEIIRRDAERQLDDMQRQSQLESRLNEILSTSNADSCRLSADELERLRSLASPSSGKRS